MVTDLQHLIHIYWSSNIYDEVLFLAQVTLGFSQLLRLAELCVSDNPQLHDSRKLMMHFEVHEFQTQVELLLPGHKADKFFQGHKLITLNNDEPTCPYPWLICYLRLCDAQHSWKPALWLHADGSSPTCSWFTSMLCRHFGSNISGHSMHAGGATALAAAGVPNDCIHAIGRWSSNSYQVYIQEHSIILLSQLHPTVLTSIPTV